MEKFTKAPWFVYDGKQFLIIRGKVCANGDDGEPIVVADTNHYFSESRANAALIAAAPEMYDDIKLDIDWLKRLRSLFVLGSDGFRSCSLRIESKEKLLAKARGEK